MTQQQGRKAAELRAKLARSGRGLGLAPTRRDWHGLPGAPLAG